MRVLVERMYGKMDITTKRLVSAILQDADPREEAETPAPYKRLAAREAVYEQMPLDLDTARAEVQTFKDAQEDAETPNNTTDAFMQKVAMAESSGDPNAAITFEDGRTSRASVSFVMLVFQIIAKQQVPSSLRLNLKRMKPYSRRLLIGTFKISKTP